MAEDIWVNYYAAFDALKGGMEAAMRDIGHPWGAEPFADNGDDYGFLMDVTNGAYTYGVGFHLNDASGAGDDEPGVRGNLMLDVVAQGGRIVGNWSVGNYTDECWQAYTGEGLEELQRRLTQIAELNGAIYAITEDSERRRIEG